MKNDMPTPTHTIPIPTPDGKFTARYSSQGLCALEFPSGMKQRRKEAVTARPAAQVLQWHAATNKSLRLTLAGRPLKAPPPIDLSSGTEFQQRVWQTLRKIPRGRTWSYAQVAQAIGNPKAVRAVGGACGANPIPVFVPCHRVVAANSGLGGFSGGLNWKRALLRREGVTVPD